MANQAKVDPKLGTVSWSLSVSNLKLGVYRARLFDASGKVLEPWNDQRTDDSIPDKFDMKTAPDKLPGCTLWWQAVISDPNDEGGPFVCVVTIEQNRTALCQDAVPGNIEAGSGQLKSIGDQIKFI